MECFKNVLTANGNIYDEVQVLFDDDKLSLREIKEEYPENAPRLMAVSESVTQICDKLELPLLGKAKKHDKIPKRYKNVPDIANEDDFIAECVKYLEVQDVIVPANLKGFNEKVCNDLGVTCVPVDLSSVEAMYQSIVTLSEKYDRQEKAKELLCDYDLKMRFCNKDKQVKTSPKVLVLTANEYTYQAITEDSYIASLLRMVGAECITDFKNAKEISQIDPDFILISVEEITETVIVQFADEFEENEHLQNLKAAKGRKIHYLDETIFGKHCNFHWFEAIQTLKEILYGKTKEGWEWFE